MLHSMTDKRRDYLGDGNPKWRGNNAKYLARHVRVRTARGNAKSYLCEGCGEVPAFEWAHTHDTDPFDIHNYTPMCIKCHRRYDDNKTLRGENHPIAKFTEAQIREIRKRNANGENYEKLAAEFGVVTSTIGCICRRTTYKEVSLCI